MSTPKLYTLRSSRQTRSYTGILGVSQAISLLMEPHFMELDEGNAVGQLTEKLVYHNTQGITEAFSSNIGSKYGIIQQ